MHKHQTRRRSARVSISSTVICESADLAKSGGEAYNLSTGGIALKTNYPIGIREQFTADSVTSGKAGGLIVNRSKR